MQQAERTGTSRKRPTVLLVCAALFLLARIGSEIPTTPKSDGKSQIRWVPIDAAPQESVKSGKPILYDFTAEWCAPCRAMDEEVYADGKSAQIIAQRFVPVKVLDRKVEEGRNTLEVDSLQSRFHVDSFPTIAIVYQNRKEPVIIQGYSGKRELMQQLEHAAKTP